MNICVYSPTEPPYMECTGKRCEECEKSPAYNKGYQRGREDRDAEIIEMIEAMKRSAFLAMANTGDGVLDVSYEILGNHLDMLVDKLKGEPNGAEND